MFSAWREFRRGKQRKNDVSNFEFFLEDNIFKLHKEFLNNDYQHGKYETFFVRDPKLRKISKAGIKDRLVHQAVFRILYHIFDQKFIYDSYSCRIGKGNHPAVLRLTSFCNKVSNNFKKNTFVLKCDIKKFFASIDQEILFKIIKRSIKNESTLLLVRKILKSFNCDTKKGLPLGNVTSQLFSNIYLNELDKFIKHSLKLKYYIRYCDDFVILDRSKDKLLESVSLIEKFLSKELKLKLHKKK